VHTYTLAAIYAGLKAASALFGRLEFSQNADLVRAFLLKHCVHPGYGFVKSVGIELTDGSLPALAVPYQVVTVDDPVIQATVKRIEIDLFAPGFGVHRYRGDSYYGGGAWLLLAAWLGWYYVERGDLPGARAILTAISRHANTSGELPEQIVPPMQAQVSDHEHWVKVRGPVATPLLWSHAMFLILAHACDRL
jgi:GH15 family glucan-1,4-alpha-glucosidase